MATDFEVDDVERERTPIALQDDGGQLILPTQHLPGVDFGAHLNSESNKKATSDQSKDVTEPKVETGSYFPQKPGYTGDVKSMKKSTTDSLNHARTTEEPAALKRVKTAPAMDSRRPKPPARSSTILQAMRRRQQKAGYPYTFDPMSSDSDSDSSSSGDEQQDPQKTSRSKKLRRSYTAAEQKDNEQRKERARQGHSYSRFRMGNEHFHTKGRVSKRDGRLNISMNETANNGYLAKALGQTVKNHLDIPNSRRVRKQRQHAADHSNVNAGADAESIASSLPSIVERPRLNIVIIVIGSRGDIQPFLKIGKILQDDYGHRVRIATHPTFRDFVEKETKLEFFSVGGDPSELMAFMVKNPGLVPNLKTIREGEIQRRRTAMSEMFDGMWRACVNATEEEMDIKNVKTMNHKAPFIADAIIANPPSMAHVHLAERLGIPLHIMFTFPYTPTQAFPHPLANIKVSKSNVDANYVNFMSYPMVELMTWQGLGDIVNKFRERTLGLEKVSSLWAPGALYRMKVPYTYMWSPSLVPKPSDWGAEIDISGFVFMDLATNFKPPQDLVDFLNAGEPPVYIGFGSIVVDDPDQLTDMIVEAVKLSGVRALVNKGWGGLGTTNENTPDNIFMLGNTPHDWLFPRCKAVVHHGGAGTTAIGLKCAKPTMIVPFFGDQPFWAARVAEAQAGAHKVVPWRQLTAEKFAEGIKQCLTEEAQQNVKKMAEGMDKEGDGAANACKSFHRSLPLTGRQNMRCSILEDRVAQWTLRGSTLRLSALAAEILLQRGKIKLSDLKLFRVYSWNDFDGPGEPISGTIGAVTESLYGIGGSVGMVPVRVAKHMKKRADHERKKAEVKRRKEARRAEKQQKMMKEESDAKAQKEQPGNREIDEQRPAASRVPTNNTMASALSADPTTPLAKEVARDVGEGLKKAGGHLLTMPNDLHVALAQGFHNAPRLWGDATVRKPIRITGFKTGCKAAGKEFTYGVYDAWTGVITQPVGGFKDGDTMPAKVRGFGIGVGKGIGGFVLKNLSAIISPPAYFGKGVIVYAKKKTDVNVQGSKAYIRRAHVVQGQKDLWALSAQDDAEKDEQLRRVQERVSEGWKIYEEIWASANKKFGPDTVRGKVKLDREKKRWAQAGALENVQTAHKALKVSKEGGDLDRHLSRRQREMDIAEGPRTAATDKPAKHEAKMDNVARDKVDTTYADDEAEREKLGEHPEGQEVSLPLGTPDGNGSDDTVAASSDDGEKDEKDFGVLAQCHHGPSDVVIGGDLVKEKLLGAGGGQRRRLGRMTTA